MKTSEILIAGRDLIADPAHWCQGHDALGEDGAAVPWDDPRAVTYCSAGALAVANGPWYKVDECPAYAALRAAMKTAEVWIFNDTYGHSDVIEAWNRAIQLALSRERAEESVPELVEVG